MGNSYKKDLGRDEQKDENENDESVSSKISPKSIHSGDTNGDEQEDGDNDACLGNTNGDSDSNPARNSDNGSDHENDNEDDDDQEDSNNSRSGVDNNSDDNNEHNAPPPPKFKIKQKVLARDTDTPLLYEAVIRKQIYAPKSKQVRICSLNLKFDSSSRSDDILNDDSALNNELEKLLSSTVTPNIWHYFVHYQGWNVKWDRWVEEDSLFEDTESSRILAKRLKEESKCLKKKKTDKVVLEVMQRMLKLEKEFRWKEARGEPLSDYVEDDLKKVENGVQKIPPFDTAKNIGVEMLENTTKNKQTTAKFIEKEVKLRQSDLCSKKTPNDFDIPFPMKKVLVDEWEVISQCGMLHDLPATVSVMDALNAYYQGKTRMLRDFAPVNDPIEEKKDDDNQENLSSAVQRETVSTVVGDNTTDNNNSDDDENNNAGLVENSEEQQWREMTSGLAMFFDHALSNKLLYRHEFPQYIVLQEKYSTKRFCEIYSCEYLLRLCLKLPELVADSQDISEKQKTEINYKVGDFLRFLQKHQDIYILQRYRKPDTDETEKAKRLQSRLGLVANSKKEYSDERDAEDIKRKRKGGKGPRKKKRTNV